MDIRGDSGEDSKERGKLERKPSFSQRMCDNYDQNVGRNMDVKVIFVKYQVEIKNMLLETERNVKLVSQCLFGGQNL